FMGSEPVAAASGPYAGTRVFEAEEQQGLALARTRTPPQLERAILATELPGEVFTAAFRATLELPYETIRFGDLSSAQKRLLRDLLRTYVDRLRPGHAQLRMEEVTRHLADTCFAWMGGVD